MEMSAEHLCDSTISFAFDAHCYIIHGQTLSGSQPILFVSIKRNLQEAEESYNMSDDLHLSNHH